MYIVISTVGAVKLCFLLFKMLKSVLYVSIVILNNCEFVILSDTNTNLYQNLALLPKDLPKFETSVQCLLNNIDVSLKENRNLRGSLHLIISQTENANSVYIEESFLKMSTYLYDWPKTILHSSHALISFRKPQIYSENIILWFISNINDLVVLKLLRELRDTKLYIIFTCSVCDEKIKRITTNIFAEFSNGNKITVVKFTMAPNYAFWSVYLFAENQCEHRARNDNFIVQKLCFINKNKNSSNYVQSKYVQEPRKMCPVKVIASNYEPYVSFDAKKGFYKGIDIFLLRNFAKQMNTSIEYEFSKLRFNEVHSSESKLDELISHFQKK